MKKKFSFIKYTWLWLTLSAITIFIGVAAMVNNQINNGQFIKLGIDFTGGTLMEISLKEGEADRSKDIREAIEISAPDKFSQINFTDQNTYIIQTKNLSNEEYNAVQEAIKSDIGEFEEIRFNTIGPKIGQTLKSRALKALTFALIAIVLFIAYAFRKVPKRVGAWKFGFCAIAALVHDIIITLGIFALLGLEVDAFFITALLTIMGFSVHDTIVVFDRIRENLRVMGRNDTFGDVADLSLHQTMARSINTSISTLFTLTALYYFGAESIKIFVFALIIGILVGTYSSVFIASPVLTLWQKKRR